MGLTMTQEDKELLLKDLCGRLPYKVYAQIPDEYGGYTSTIESIDIDGFVKDLEGTQIEIENIKPYLLPLSSMTEEQRNFLHKNPNGVYIQIFDDTVISASNDGFDWLNENYFDYRGFIPMGLALDATGLNIY
jgi:hypothetical protein